MDVTFRTLSLAGLALLLFPVLALAEGPLHDCRDQFIDGDVANAPTIGRSAPDEPFLTNVHLCYRDAESSFFALEYWAEEFAPRWTAYRLVPENYGEQGCATYTRRTGNCYARSATWSDFEACADGNRTPSDPFHRDHMLSGTTLVPGDFTNTGHDRGHLAPRLAFSWNACAAYQTFTMANMSPQRGFFNQQIWADLERQVVTWAFDDGPLYVVSGATFRRFPHQRFAVYQQDRTLDPDEIYWPGVRMQAVVERHREHFETYPSGHILRPARTANPEAIADRVRDMRMPTGYFKVIYRPATGSEPARAIGFLLPHSFENLRLLAEAYDGLPQDEAFWAFVARIDLIESVSGMRFPGVSDDLKRQWGDSWFLKQRTGRNIRSTACGRGTPQGVLENSTRQERIDACIQHLR